MTKKDAYSKGLYLYGFYTLCCLIDEYEKAENFEECQIIFDVLKEHNTAYKSDLPTKYDEDAKVYFKRIVMFFSLTGETLEKNLPYYVRKVKTLVSECV